MEKLEGALLGLEALSKQTLNSLLPCGMLALADNAPLSGLHQILFDQATGSMLGSSVKHLGLGAHRDGGTSHHIAIAIAIVIVAILASRVGIHLLYLPQRNYAGPKRI
jgi:hypothetical protein